MGSSTDSGIGHLQHIYSTFTVLFGYSRAHKDMLEKAYFPRLSEFGGFFHTRDPHAIPTQSIYRRSDNMHMMYCQVYTQYSCANMLLLCSSSSVILRT